MAWSGIPSGEGRPGLQEGRRGKSSFTPTECREEGVLLRNDSPSLVLSDHFPGVRILELQCRSGQE